MVLYYKPLFVPVKIEAAAFSETSVSYNLTTRCHNPGNRENFKSGTN